MHKNTILLTFASSILLGTIAAESAEALNFTGSLKPGEIKKFEFQATGLFEFLALNTDGSKFDTELGLYDSVGNRIAIDDDGGNDLLSLILEANDSKLDGNLTAVLGGFDTFYGATINDVIPGNDSEGGDYVLNIATLDLESSSSSESSSYEAGELLNFSITPINDLSFLTVNTIGSDFDTELGLYDADNNFISSDDDIGFGIEQSIVSAFIDDDNKYSSLTAVLGAFDTDYGETIENTTIISSLSGNYQISVDQYVNAGSVKPVPEGSNVFSLLAFGTAIAGFTMKLKLNSGK